MEKQTHTIAYNHQDSFKCDLCGHQHSTPVFVGKDFMHGLADQCPLVACASCGLITLYPQPENLADFYPAQSYHAYKSQHNSSDDLARSVNRSLMKRADWLAQQISADQAQISLLDLGCGEGGFLRATLLSEFGNAKRIGIDFSPQACFASHIPGQIDTGVSALDRLPFPDHSFEIVTMWHVLEHVRSPQQVLLEIKRLLKPGGTLMLACPVVDSFEAQFFRRYWAGYDVPRHLHTFSRSTLRALLQNAGFQGEEVRGLVAGWHSIKTSWQFLLGFGSYQTTLAKVLAWPIFIIERLVFHSPSVAVFAAKSP
ncbi:MAG: class I SAM-dependent methyltransferase [Chloroflexota bacterium]